MITSTRLDPMAALAASLESSAQAAYSARNGQTMGGHPPRAGGRSGDADRPRDLAGPNARSVTAAADGREAADGAALRFDMHEVQHRLKNVLAVVQSICNQTIRHSTTKEDFEKRFSARLFALCNSLDLLIGSDWKGIELHDLVRAQLGPFSLPADGQVVCTGPVVTLGPDASRNIGMALHELATNAVKHGCLSVPQGIVTLTWEVASRPEGQRFLMTWVETGGPHVAEPTHRGFGRQVIQNSGGFGRGGQVAYHFLPQGVRWSLDVAASAVIAPNSAWPPVPVPPAALQS